MFLQHGDSVIIIRQGGSQYDQFPRRAIFLFRLIVDLPVQHGIAEGSDSLESIHAEYLIQLLIKFGVCQERKGLILSDQFQQGMSS